MRSCFRAVIGLFLLALLVSTALAAGSDKAPAKRVYSAQEKSGYLSKEELEFIRPGLQFKIDSFTIPADTLKPVVRFTIKDDQGQPLDRDGVLTPGAVSSSWILGRINAGETQYTSYTTRSVTSPITKVTAIQPAADSGGAYKKISDGVYEYTFGTALPASYPKNVTTTLGLYSTRDLRNWGGTRHVVNIIQNFVPDGSAVKTVRDVSRTETCNLCHDPLQAHGGSRQKLELCIMCHTTNAIDPDTGQSVDMKIMVHKIHRGKGLPSVVAGKPYQIIGNAQSVHDYSTVGFPRDIRSCETCHQKAAQAVNWYLEPTRDTCGSCHDLVDWKSGKGHAGGAQISDRFCATCHIPQGELEFDASIKGAHVNPQYSAQLNYPKFEIVSITNAKPGGNMRIDFKIKNKKGENINPRTMTALRATVAGPTKDISYQLSETITNPPVSGDTISYNFIAPLPANATGSFIVGLEGYVNATINAGTTKEATVRDRADVTYQTVAVTDSKPVARRQVVTKEKCNACHEKLLLHGGNRDDANYCVTCHNPVNTDVTTRPAGEKPEQTIDMRTMIHKIHTGEELNREYTVYGRGGSKNDFTEVRYPGDRRDCQQCHLPGTYNVPLSEGLLSVTTKRDYFTPTPPESAACLACHDSRSTAAHAYVNIAPFGEACAACHGTGADFAVDKVHAR